MPNFVNKNAIDSLSDDQAHRGLPAVANSELWSLFPFKSPSPGATLRKKYHETAFAERLDER